MKRIAICLLVTVLLLTPLAGCAPRPTPAPWATTDYTLDDDVSRATNAFGLGLLQRLYSSEPGNTMISPVSLAMALGMTANGAFGETQAGMLEGLALADVRMERANDGYAAMMQRYANPDLPVTLAIANAIWARDDMPFHDAYLEDTALHYDAELTSLPFNDAAIKRINNWVDDKTRGEIPTILNPPVNPEAVLFLTNAIYFKGAWRAPFDPDRTLDRPFTLLDGSQIGAPMMSQEATLPVVSGGSGDAAYRVAALPYGEGGDVRMLLVLPNATDGLPAVLASLSAEDLTRWDSELVGGHEVELVLPRFKSDYQATLNDTLSAMGMSQAFDRHAADFSAMSPEGDRFFISKVVHKSTITVDEEGTVAAAATVVEVAVECVMETDTFICDHPFLYVIWDGGTDTALFIGVLTQP